MPKYKFATKKKREPSVTRIMLLIGALVVIAYFGAQWYTGRMAAGVDTAQATASFQEQTAEIQARMSAGEYAQARDLLQPLVSAPSAPLDIVLLQAQAEQELGNQQEALKLLERAVKDYTNDPQHPAAAARYAKLLEASGAAKEAIEIYKDINENAPPEHRAAAIVGLARDAQRAGDLEEARTLLHKALADAAWRSPAWEDAVDILGEVNVALIFAVGSTSDSKTYSVESGDNLTDIGIKLNTTLGLLMRANNIDDPGRLHLGQNLKYTPKDFRIVIERSTCQLFLMDNDGIFKRYQVGLGMPGYETTPGKYKIGNKQKDPTWHKPGAEAIPPNDPRNELGTRWMPLVPTEEGLPTDLGIHGTIAPETIGKFESHGCARLLKEDVEELYDLVVRSTPVEIVEIWQPTGTGEARYIEAANVPDEAA
jgi:lipoprotein-anchoring transpeptidase ErfK/SrfK